MKFIKKITASEPKPNRCSAFSNIAKHGEITTTFQFIGIALEPHRNRK